ncbi:MAG: choice-of-anchor O protein, partial [Acidobacteriota bacterium]
MRHFVWVSVLLVAFGAIADDGEMLRRNIPSTPELDSEHAALKMMPFYVPAQNSEGELLTEGIEYLDFDEVLVETRTDARPLVATYQDGHVDSIEGIGFKGHGQRDAFAAVSLDDGQTWKRKNLSNSGDLSSFSIKVKKKWLPYPGDVVTMFTAVENNKVLVTWASRYCQGGDPTYAFTDEEKDILVAYDDTLASGLVTVDGIDYRLYLDDLFGVGGSQSSSDFADEGYPEVGEVPFSCLWAARGTLELDSVTGLHDVVWRKAERLTSGRRDVNRVETACEPGAGCVITWQEDPDGLRPGEGEGPGEGWSGAIAHHQTDIWYSYIDWDHFDLVDGDDGNPIPLVDYISDTEPKVGIPMSIPVRLTDNAMCTYITEPNVPGYSPYCVADLDESGGLDACETQTDLTITDIVTGDQTTIVNVCVAEDGRLMRGNTASTRARLNLRGYDVDGHGIYDSAWVITAYEESKGLGEEEVDAAIEAG